MEVAEYDIYMLVVKMERTFGSQLEPSLPSEELGDEAGRDVGTAANA